MNFKTRLSAFLLLIIISLSTLIGCDGLPLEDILSGLPSTGDSSEENKPTDGQENDPPEQTPEDKPGDNTESKPAPEDKPDGGEDPPDTGNTPDGGELPDFEDSSDEGFETDPYIGVDKTEFYKSYKPASCLKDALYRSEHFLMSGSIAEQDEAPTVAENRPKENGLYIRNTASLYKDGGNTYIVIDSEGREAFRVYKGGAYVTLEEVAAYVFAFGEIPANYVSKKSGKPSTNPWGIYLRLNHSLFTGDTAKYPYEPELPNISGCGGKLSYYEMDIGTTGTTCDPSYTAKPYNNGTKITRGAARIVYTRYDKNGDKIISPDERYLFYTYNHYNDFQEYLNYEGGWGELFGNVTGGGTISSKYDYNPTPYVEVQRQSLLPSSAAQITHIYIMIPEIVNQTLHNKRKIF